MEIVQILLISFISAWSGLMFGAIISFFLKRKQAQVSTIIAILSGFMLTFVFLDLIPESLSLGSHYLSIFGIILGALVSIGVEKILNHFSHEDHNTSLLLIATSIGIHHITAGIALGMVLFASLTEGMHLTIILMLHGIPEGIIIGYFIQHKNKLLTGIFITTLTALPMVIGSLVGIYIGSITQLVATKSLAFTSGILLYTIFKELIPRALKKDQINIFAYLIIIGIVLGMINLTLMH